MFNQIEEAITALKNGEIIIVIDDENRENEGDFIVLGEFATPEAVNFMAAYGRGLICTPVSQTIASQLNLHPMIENNTDPHQTAFTISVDFHTSTTGISAFERSDTIQALFNPAATAQQFKRPGHVFPLIAKDGGVLTRRGHTEAAVDLAKLCDSPHVGVICEIMNDDGTMARVPDLWKIAEQFNLKFITIDALATYLTNKKLQLA